MCRTDKICNLLVYLLVLAIVPGCQSMQAPLYDSKDDAPETIIERVQVGDCLEVHTLDGEAVSFTVIAIEDTALVGHDIRVGISDISRVRSLGSQNTGGDTGKLVVVTVLLVIIGVAVMAALPNPYEGMLAGGLF